MDTKSITILFSTFFYILKIMYTSNSPKWPHTLVFYQAHCLEARIDLLQHKSPVHTLHIFTSDCFRSYQKNSNLIFSILKLVLQVIECPIKCFNWTFNDLQNKFQYAEY